MRKKIEHFVDDEETKTRQDKPHAPVSDEEDDGHDRWYLLLLYLEKDSHGRLKEPYKIVDGAPDWCPEILEQWIQARKEGFKVP